MSVTVDTTAQARSMAATSSHMDVDHPTLRRRVVEMDTAWTVAAGHPAPSLVEEARELVAEFVAALELGMIRAAEPDAAAEGGWRVEAWVKTGILLGFRLPGMTEHRDGPILAARDRSSYGVLDLLDGTAARAAADDGAPWRVVPGGSTVRSGVHLEPGVTIMPPSYANIGAWVGEGSMIDSHVLVGSCAQIGRDVHLAAAVQVGGVMEPPGARPVIIEEGAFVGGGSGLYEGVTISRGAVIGAGVVITGQSRLIDLAGERELRGSPEMPLVVPPGAVVVPGTRPASSAWAREQGISIDVPLIAKYRDENTDARVALEDALR